MHDMTTDVHKAVADLPALALIERMYILRNSQTVTSFLEQHPFLVSLLGETHQKIQDYFPQAPVFLEVVSDPEAVHDLQLVASVGTDLAVDTAFDKLKQFDHEWFLGVLDQARGVFYVNVEFQ